MKPLRHTFDWKFFISLSVEMVVLFLVATAWESSAGDRARAQHPREQILHREHRLLLRQDQLIVEISRLKTELRRENH